MKIVLELTPNELKDLEKEYMALSQQGCLDKDFCIAHNYEYDAKYVKRFNSVFNKIRKANTEYEQSRFEKDIAEIRGRSKCWVYKFTKNYNFGRILKWTK